jgi:hypothetical protein
MANARNPASLPRNGDCVRVPDGRIGRVRGREGALVKVRVRRRSSNSHQFMMCNPDTLEPVSCPKGWMSPEGYQRYLRVTLRKMRARSASDKKKKRLRRGSRSRRSVHV